MPVTIKSAREIELMAEAGRILEIVHNELRDALHAGMSTLDIDRLGEEIIRSYDCIPSFLNYNGYPASICVSLNQEVVHGIPDKHRLIQRYCKSGCRSHLQGVSFRCGQNLWSR
jgi:methionyl aminopeptidase